MYIFEGSLEVKLPTIWMKHTSDGFGALLEVEMLKKVHAVVARSTFPSQNVQNTSASVHFWKLRC